MEAQSPPICVAVEGDVDAAIVRKIAASLGLPTGPFYVAHGKQPLLRRLSAYNAAAQHAPWIVLVDLDQDFACAPAARSAWLPSPATQLCLRVAVRAAEAWLLADSKHLAQFLSVRVSQFPVNPESLPDPKRTLVDLAQHSSRPALRAAIVPRSGSGRAVGPNYTGRMLEFVQQRWDPAAASLAAPSLAGLLRCLEALRT